MVKEFLYTEKVNGKVTFIMANGGMESFMVKEHLLGQTGRDFLENGKKVCFGISPVIINMEE